MKEVSHTKRFDSHPPPAGIWIDIEDIGVEGLIIDIVKSPSFFDFDDRDFKIVHDVTINCSLSRSEHDVYLKGKVSTTLKFRCSRCIDNFIEDIDTEFSAEYIPEKKEYHKEEIELGESDLNVYYYEGGRLDIFPSVMDQILLSIPIKPLCNENCLGLCPHCGQKLNIHKCSCKEEDGDNRFSILKRIQH
jgi:uncharacterized protein